MRILRFSMGENCRSMGISALLLRIRLTDMESYSWSLFGLIAGVTAGLSGGSWFPDHVCTMTFYDCLHPSSRNITDNLETGKLVPDMTDQEFNHLCSNHVEIENCTAEVKPLNCTELGKYKRLSIAQTMVFLCQTDPQGYLENRHCMSDPELQEEIFHCGLNNQPIGTSNWCQVQNRELSCEFGVLNDRCSSDEAQWFQKLLLASTQPIHEFLPNCALAGSPTVPGSSSRSGVIVAACFAGILFIVLACAAIWYYRRKQHYRNIRYKQANSEMGHM